MAKNDYKRQLIMLRSLEKGYSGHARLERRVTSGTLDIIAGAPSEAETLAAALIGMRGGNMQAKTLGQMRPDGRGQRALLASFDPRNLSGMDLNDVSLLVISELSASGVRPVLSGNIGGARNIDFSQVRRLLEDAYSEKRPEAPLTADRTDGFENNEPAEESDPPSPPENALNASSPPPEPPELHKASPSSEPEPDEARPSASRSSSAPAGAYLDVDMSRPWPSDIDSLRLLFLTSPRFEPFEREGYVFVKAQMAEETGVDHCAVGVRAENGSVTGICYAIPMPASAQPPAGLEGYEWVGDGNSGWWVTCDDVRPDDAQSDGDT